MSALLFAILKISGAQRCSVEKMYIFLLFRLIIMGIVHIQTYGYIFKPNMIRAVLKGKTLTVQHPQKWLKTRQKSIPKNL